MIDPMLLVRLIFAACVLCIVLACIVDRRMKQEHAARRWQRERADREREAEYLRRCREWQSDFRR